VRSVPPVPASLSASASAPALQGRRLTRWRARGSLAAPSPSRSAQGLRVTAGATGGWKGGDGRGTALRREPQGRELCCLSRRCSQERLPLLAVFPLRAALPLRAVLVCVLRARALNIIAPRNPEAGNLLDRAFGDRTSRTERASIRPTPSVNPTTIPTMFAVPFALANGGTCARTHVR